MSKYSEPVAYAVFAENGNIRIWSADPVQAEALRQEYGDQVQALYAAPQHQPEESLSAADYEEVLADRRSLARELDVLLNGEEGAAKQASLCDLLGQMHSVVVRTGKPVLTAPDVSALVEALDGAARSLETISKQSGIDEYMRDFLEVRGYARNRATVARMALAAYRKQWR